MEEKEEEEEEKEESLTIEFSGMGSRGESWNNFISISLGGGETLRLRLAVQVSSLGRTTRKRAVIVSSYTSTPVKRAIATGTAIVKT